MLHLYETVKADKNSKGKTWADFASLLASHGYLFPIDDHILTVKNDSNSLYRFQTRYFWPSNCWSPENTDYAVYLCKRTMQNKVSVMEISISSGHCQLTEEM